MLATILATTVLLSYVIVAIAGIKSVLIDGPAFEHNTFDLRHGKIKLIEAKPASITWEEPEAYLYVATERRVLTNLGYKVEIMGQK